MKPLFILLLVMAFIGCGQKKKPLTIDELLTTVNGDSIKSHIAFLADDNLKGRLPGTPEYAIAVNYVVEQYKRLGLEPAGEDDTYLQDVVIRRGIVDHDNSSLSINAGKKSFHWMPGKDYVFLGDLNASSNEVYAPVVYVGYGIDAPSLDHCDYCDIDVKNKIVILRSGAPESFPSTELAHFSNLGTKFETAIKNGALGFILTASDANFKRMGTRFMSAGNTGVVGPDGLVFGIRVFGPELKFVAMVNEESIKNLTDNNSNFDLPPDLSVSAKTKTMFTEFSSPNVIGKLEGGDPEISSEYVVHTAHLDHLGIGEPINGDSIYNGAHDNASGVASLIEIARLYTNLPEKPKRSILFVMVTAEEIGLLGSDYFTRFPTVPIGQIIANVNTDMPTLIAPLLSIEPIGAEHSSIMKNVEEAAGKLNLEIMPDHMPEQVRFVRSDQYNFVRQGIPALHVKYGLKSLDSLTDLSGLINDYTANIYHKPSDELNDLFNFEAGEVYVKLNFLISYSIAQAKDRPAWNEGDFFSKK